MSSNVCHELMASEIVYHRNCTEQFWSCDESICGAPENSILTSQNMDNHQMCSDKQCPYVSFSDYTRMTSRYKILHSPGIEILLSYVNTHAS